MKDTAERVSKLKKIKKAAPILYKPGTSADSDFCSSFLIGSGGGTEDIMK